MKSENSSNLFDLSGKVVVITGAGGLLGRQHCEAVASSGGTPILLDISENLIKDFSRDLKEKFKVDAMSFKVDITQENEIQNNVKVIISKFGKIDALVNNAANNPIVSDSNSGEQFSRLENFSIDQWNKDLAVGLTGSFLCAKHYGNFISKNSNGGVIINISSDLGIIAPDQRLYKKPGVPDNEQITKPVSYSVSKSGLIGLTKYIATYWVDQNVRCNAICPGGVETDQPQEFLNKISSRIPLNRLAKAYEYRSTLIYMLSDSSSYLNGSIISVDGGRTAW
jgi:NAD(P)-dependent dehydrogenase (short-subunit alcohol dehydrogenase family)